MAERRMFAKTVIDSDAFLDMPLSTQALYFHIGVRAKDKGILNNIFTIAKMLGCTKDDVKDLLDNGFIKPIIDSELGDEWQIVHWYENNGIGETAKKRNNYNCRQWRKAVIDRDKKCVVCGSVYDLQAHHIKSFAQFPLLRFEVDNGITMCEKCHRLHHRIHDGKERENGRC